MASQPSPQPSWKQEVNQRLAAHKIRKGLSVVAEPAPGEAQSVASIRAAKAAARVAARFAHAPSYSEMQAAEARTALRAAEVATRAALEAQAAARVALDNIETANIETADEDALFACEDELPHAAADYATRPANEAVGSLSAPAAMSDQHVEIRWDPDLPVLPSAPPVTHANYEQEESKPEYQDWRGPAATAMQDNFAAEAPIETVEPAQPIYANLIQFPREIIATRRIRPRITGPEAGTENEQFGQLSIFEVDPASVSTEAAQPGAGAAARSFAGPEWSGIKLDAQPETDADAEAGTAAPSPRLELAPFGLRLMAAVVDTALIAGFLCADAAMAAAYMKHPPTMKAAELAAVIAIIAASALYHWLFLMLSRATPGMRYARISICTFDDEIPSREQLRNRLGAMLLSLLPVGLGVGWAIFDDDHLTWHDRLSRTYLRRY